MLPKKEDTEEMREVFLSLFLLWCLGKGNIFGRFSASVFFLSFYVACAREREGTHNPKRGYEFCHYFNFYHCLFPDADQRHFVFSFLCCYNLSHVLVR